MSPRFGFSGFSDTPADITETLVGLRLWKVSLSGRLLPVSWPDHAWQEGMNTARCLSNQPRGEAGRLLDPECGCGFWAYTGIDPASASEWVELAAQQTGAAATRHTAGVIVGWGRAVVGPKGFRCEYAAVAAVEDTVRIPPSQWSAEWAAETLTATRAAYPDVARFRDLASMLTEWPLSDLQHLLTDPPPVPPQGEEL